MQCSVVIPYKDRIEALINTLHSLSMQRTARAYEVIVVDDGSVLRPQDLVPQGLNDGCVRFLNQPNAGISRARNAGWQSAKGDVVIFLDCDMVVHDTFIENHCRAFDLTTEPILQVGSRRQLPESSLGLPVSGLRRAQTLEDDRTGFFATFSYNMAGIEIAWHLCFGHNVSVRRDQLLRVAGYDEAFAGWGLEDCEFAYRMRGIGAKLLYNPAVEGLHQYHEFCWPMEHRRYIGWRDNLAYFCSKHPEFSVKIQYLLDAYFNPENRVLDNIWVDILQKMERVARLANDRPNKLPQDDEFRQVLDRADVDGLIQFQLDPSLSNTSLWYAN